MWGEPGIFLRQGYNKIDEGMIIFVPLHQEPGHHSFRWLMVMEKKPLPPESRPSLRVRLLFLWRKLIKPLPVSRRAEVQVNLRQAAHPGVDFFLLVVLSCVIATLGLLIDSPATVIGAMLVAPLMSPIIGLGLSSITGDERLLRDSTLGLGQGALFAILISFIITLIYRNLPFLSLNQLPAEVLARTHPTPVDLGIALAGGLAAAFALAMPHISAALPGVAISTALMPPLCTIGIGLGLNDIDISGGASLLFITNAVTIAFAAALVFFFLGFNPEARITAGRVPRFLFISALFTIIILGTLTYFSYGFVISVNENLLLATVVKEEAARLDTEVIEWDSKNENGTLLLDMVVRTTRLLRYEDSVELQRAIADRLQTPVAVIVEQVFAARLDPLIPPTHTPTPDPTFTFTPGPSPTPTSTPTLTPTYTETPTETPTATPIPSDTPTLTFTPTPAQAVLVRATTPPLRLFAHPGGPVIGYLKAGQVITVLYGRQEINGIIWIEVQDPEGRIGWIPEFYLELIEPPATPNPAITLTHTPTPAPLLSSTVVKTITSTPTLTATSHPEN